MIDSIAVVIPAANEQRLIGRCLDAVHRAAAAVDRPVQIIVVLDGCTDGTAAEVGRRRGVRTVVCDARNVGTARRLGSACALEGSPVANAVWLANTDADSQVPPDWLSRMVLLETTADVVLGTVVPDAGLSRVVERAWHGRHPQQEHHPYVHGANFGLHANAYRSLGGWRALRTGEDADLATRARAACFRVRATATIPVLTSSRGVGRVPHGFSSYVTELDRSST